MIAPQINPATILIVGAGDSLVKKDAGMASIVEARRYAKYTATLYGLIKMSGGSL